MEPNPLKTTHLKPIPLGLWDGKELSIDMYIVVDKDEGKTTRMLDAEIKNPDGGDPIAVLQIIIGYPKSDTPVHIELFMVSDREQGGDKLKGLGKAMLCAVFKKLVKIGSVPDYKIVTLDAGGGFMKDKLLPDPNLSDEELKQIIRKYGDDALKKLEEQYETQWKPLGVSYRNVLIQSVRNINQTRRLITYYEGYGFRVQKDHGVYAEMMSQVFKILKACSPPKKEGGKKTRRIKRKQKFSRRK